MAFLNKANRDPFEGRSSSDVAKTQGEQQKQRLRATQPGVDVPAPLAALVARPEAAVYVSDADEPFEPVALAWDEGGRGLPDEGTFCVLLSALFLLFPFYFDRQMGYSDDGSLPLEGLSLMNDVQRSLPG